MLEWLKNILGDGYTDDIDKRVSSEIGKAFVSKADFNVTNENYKQLMKTAQKDKIALDNLGDTLTRIAILTAELANEKVGRLADKKAWNLQAALTANGCTDADYVAFKLGDTVEYDENGQIKDTGALLKTVTKNYPTQFAKREEDKRNLVGLKPTEGGNQLLTATKKA